MTVTDRNGRKFDNISSLVFDWSLSDNVLASLPHELDTEVIVTPAGRKQVSSKYTQALLQIVTIYTK